MKKERQEARNLILLLSSATFIAFLVVIGLVYYFGLSGTYLLRDVLISPETLNQLNVNKIEFMQNKQGQNNHFAVSSQAYADFYKAVYNERSVSVVTDEMIRQFNVTSFAALTLTVKVYDKKGAESVIFQEIQFVEGKDLFRVRPLLQPTQHASDEWIYFRYPGIYEQAAKLLARPLNNG